MEQKQVFFFPSSAILCDVIRIFFFVFSVTAKALIESKDRKTQRGEERAVKDTASTSSIRVPEFDNQQASQDLRVKVF